jgi:hypothetical protein
MALISQTEDSKKRFDSPRLSVNMPCSAEERRCRGRSQPERASGAATYPPRAALEKQSPRYGILSFSLGLAGLIGAGARTDRAMRHSWQPARVGPGRRSTHTPQRLCWITYTGWYSVPKDT